MNPQHLLELAEQMVLVPTGRPRQAALRRAVSTLYYSLFHLLTKRGASLIKSDSDLRLQIARKFNHGAMKTVSDWLQKGNAPSNLKSLLGELPTELERLAGLFVKLYEARQRADYDGNPEVDFTKSEVAKLIGELKSTLVDWPTIGSHPATEVYLLAMLHHPLNNRSS